MNIFNWNECIWITISRGQGVRKDPIDNKSHEVMTSSNGNIFRVTGPLCGKFTGQRWIPRTKASDAELWCPSLICTWINGWINSREAGDLRRYLAHYDAILMSIASGSGLALNNRGQSKQWLISSVTLFASPGRVARPQKPNQFGLNIVNMMAADALAPCVASSSTAMILTM